MQTNQPHGETGGGPGVEPRGESGPDARALLALAQQEFDPDVVYLNTASMGLPPRSSLDAVRRAQDEWSSGTASPAAYDAPLAAARADYAALVGTAPSCVAVGSQVSPFAGLVAASLPEGSEVLTAAGEFTSVVFPFHAQRSGAYAYGRCPWTPSPPRSRPVRRWSRSPPSSRRTDASPASTR